MEKNNNLDNYQKRFLPCEKPQQKSSILPKHARFNFISATERLKTVAGMDFDTSDQTPAI